MSIDDADRVGRLSTESGPRTTAPMWARPLLTIGEWLVYSTLWSFANWNGGGVFPSHQAIANRAVCDRGSVASAVRKFDELGLIRRSARERENGSTQSNNYQLVEVCPPHLVGRVASLLLEHEQAQQEKAKARRASDKGRKGGYSTQSTPANPDITEGGAPHGAPPGCSTQSTPGTPGGAPFTYPVTNPGFDQSKDSPPPSAVTHSAREREVQGGEEISQEGKSSNDEIRAYTRTVAVARPGWSTKAVEAAVVKAWNDRPDLSLETVLVAARRCYADAGTWSPGRLHEAGPWWPSGSPQKPKLPPSCGECDGNRMRYRDGDVDFPFPCPVCKPDRVPGPEPEWATELADAWAA